MVVKIRRRLAKKNYYGTTYEYERFFIEIPKEHHKAIQPFLDKELKLHITKKEDELILRLSQP